MNETTMTVVGTLITAVNRRRLEGGTTVVDFRVASNERRYDRGTDSWVDGDTFYVGVTCWRRLAENVHASFVRGDPIMVRGRVYTRSYDKDGRRNSVTEIKADSVGPDLTRCTAAVTRNPKSAAAAPDTTPENGEATFGAGRAQEPGWSSQGSATSELVEATAPGMPSSVSEAVPAAGC